MSREAEIFRDNDKHQIWQRYCGFLDLSIDEFMEIQERLLLEQIGMVASSPLGRVILKDRRPSSLGEFRRIVPLTTYDDYAPYIADRQEDCLAQKPCYWVHTSHTNGAFKQVPWSEQFVQAQLRNLIATLILSSAIQKGDIQLKPGCRILSILPERPFVSAQLAFGLVEQFPVRSVLPLELCEKLPFRQKIDAALKQALSTDVDYIMTMTSSFMPMERGFHHVVRRGGLFPLLPRLHPKAFLRLLKNQPRKLINRNGEFLPRDLWSVKGIVAWGADSDAFRNNTEQQWGKLPFQFYGSSESGLIAMQDWRKDKMTFLPDSVFLEFIPWGVSGRENNVSTLLLNELEEGKLYELVITNFYGMPFMRYRQGDVVKITANIEKDASKLPTLTFHSRADDVIDLFGIARLNTKTVSEALELTGIGIGGWAMRKEYEKGKPVISLYIELNGTGFSAPPPPELEAGRQAL
jgi:hypothetical protein